MEKIGFIGCGNMGFALMSGLVKAGKQDQLVCTDKDTDAEIKVITKLNIGYIRTNKELAQQAKYIVLAVKPQFMDEVIEEIKDVVTEENVIISIAPVAIEKIKNGFGKDLKYVRVMPNTPALIGEGMSVVSFSNAEFTQEEKDVVNEIFKSCGKVEIMEERYLDAVTAISGSSPAYVYMFIEAMADAGVKNGLPRNIAYKLAAQTVLGSAKMVLETGEHPAVLKDRVCSPGGTTIAAVAVLEEKGFRSAVIEAMEACYNKTVSMSAK